MGQKLFRFLRGGIKCFTPPMETVWEVPFQNNPAVFCPNHSGALGPFYIMSHFPMRDELAPWINADMMNPETVPAYVRQDYWWKPDSALAPFYNATLPNIAKVFIPPILNSVPNAIGVYHNMHITKTFRESLVALNENKHLVIFAEQPSGYLSHCTKLNDGFLLIAPMAYKRYGICLDFYPVLIDTKTHKIKVSAPIRFNPDLPLKEQKEAIITCIANGIRRS